MRSRNETKDPPTPSVPADKSEKELAFLYDLFIAPDWGERFAELFDEHLKLPQKGRALYLNAGTGSHAMVLQERGGHELSWLWIDENHERLELARAKAITTKASAEFQTAPLESLKIAADQFDLALADGSLVAPERVRGMIAELVRVARPGAVVAFALPSAASFGEFFSIFWEALYNCDLIDHQADVESLITELTTVSQIEELARLEGVAEINSWTRIEEFEFASGKAFINAPLISEFLLRVWLKAVPEKFRDPIIQQIVRLIDEERRGGEFLLTMKATLVSGRKGDLPLAG